jgi:uncharacterized protein
MDFPANSGVPSSTTINSNSRVHFIQKTYLHLFLNIVLFSILTFAFLFITPLQSLLAVIAGSRWMWLIMIVAFGIGAGILQGVAYNSTSKTTQYSALLGFILLEALIFSPIAVYALAVGVLLQALLATIGLFGVLTLSVLVTKTNYNFLQNFLVVGTLASGLVILIGIAFGLNIFGTIFSIIMILLMCGWVLYDTSKISREYPENKYIAASIAIFADFVSLLWYVIQLLGGSRR